MTDSPETAVGGETRAFAEWFPKYRDLVDRLTANMDDLLGDQFDLDKPALAVELAGSAWHWARKAQYDAWDAGYRAAVNHCHRGVLGSKHPGNPYSQSAAPVGGESAAPQDGGSTPPSGGLGPCTRPGCFNRLMDENFGPRP